MPRRRLAPMAAFTVLIVGGALWFALSHDTGILGATDFNSSGNGNGNGNPSGSDADSSAADTSGTGQTRSDAAAYDSDASATVERVVDGDTIIVKLDGVSERVRLLNIDTPESVKPDSPVECLGPEASVFLTSLLPAETAVTLEFDRDRRDRYDRMLDGVVTADGTLVNASIARAGFAEPLEIGGNGRFTPPIEAAVAEARASAVGLWASGACESDGG